ncbi:cytochrome b [Dyella japonica]|uniref:Cytochrome b561 n=1 Tax=Dyella japonica TaxID=231455 RepID=A0ABV2JQ89_9GAMM
MNSLSPMFRPVQRVLHWVMAACIIAMFFIGVGMVATIAPGYLGLIATHQSLGIIILLLVIVRLMVRWRYGAPALPVDLPVPMKLAASLSHYLLYGLMIAMPLLGWAMLSAAGYPAVIFGNLHLPSIAPRSLALHTALWNAHHYLAFAFFALVLLHLAAALFHALVRRDGVFQAMAPWFGRRK